MKEFWKGLKIYIGLLVSILMIYSCSSPSGESTPEPAKVEESKPAMHSVEMIQMKFFPAELKVRKGDKVVFVNHDLVAHDITEESKKLWNSSPLASDQTWILEVTESVSYYCSIHPVMKGKIVVE